MSVETAPSFNTAIFNQANFTTTSVSSTSNIGIDYLDANYTKFPTAQTGQTQTLYGLTTITDNITLRNSLGFPITVGKGNGNIATNTCFGYSSLNSNTTGANNTAFGYESLTANTTGNRNSALGYRSLKTNITGSDNTAVGSDALTLSTSSNNTALGYKAGGANTTGSNNTYIGANNGATQNTTGSNNTLIGYQATCGSANSNCTCIGYDATATASNQVVLGSALNTEIRTRAYLTPLYTISPSTSDYVGFRDQALNIAIITLVAATPINIVSLASISSGIWLITATAKITNGATASSIKFGINNNTNNLTTTPAAIESQYVVGSGFVYSSVSAIINFYGSGGLTYRAIAESTNGGTVAVGEGGISAVRLA
jgi:hypothetical protein